MRGRIIEQQQLFSTVQIENFIPQDHYLRKIDAQIDSKIIEEATNRFYDDKMGRPSIAPEVFFRIQIIYYLYGIRSERQLCEQIQYNLAFRWFCRIPLEENVPNHSSLTRIRKRFGKDVFENIFKSFVKKWIQQNVISGKSLLTDGSLIEADASLDSMIRIDGEEHESDDQGKDRYSNKTHEHCTDKEAKIVGRAGHQKKLYYKNHQTIDAKSRIILDCHVTSGSTQECKIYLDRLDYIKESYKIDMKEVVADKGYGRGSIYAGLEQRKIRSYIPYLDNKTRKKHIRKNGFSYEEKKDRIKCPVGKYLYPYKKTYQGSQKYRMVGGHCKGCPFEDKCLPKKQRHRALTLDRSIYESSINRARKREGSKIFKKKLYERMWKAEGLFGEAKKSHNMRRLRYRGIEWAQGQVLMVAIVQNLKRVASKKKGYFKTWFNNIFCSLQENLVLFKFN